MTNFPIWLRPHNKGVILLLYVQPGASRTELKGTHAERLKLKIKSPPVEGKANEEVIEFLAGVLGISKTRVHLIRGESSRSKDVLVELSPESVISSFSSHSQQ
jgi:uncharacterized protein